MTPRVLWGPLDARTPIRTPQVPLHLPHLPGGFDGFRIAVVSDLHFGHYVREPFVRRVLELAMRDRPDLLVLLGDMADRDRLFVTRLARMLRPICRRVRTFAVLGNHEHYCGAGHFRRVMRSAGVEVLVNAHRLIRTPRSRGGGIAVAGVDDLHSGRPDVGAALADITPGTFTILLEHRPDLADRIDPSNRVDLMLCGHTHGGQVRLFGRALVTETRNPRYVCGLVQGPRFPVYISRGLGVTRLPLRIDCDPELPLILLHTT